MSMPWTCCAAAHAFVAGGRFWRVGIHRQRDNRGEECVRSVGFGIDGSGGYSPGAEKTWVSQPCGTEVDC